MKKTIVITTLLLLFLQLASAQTISKPIKLETVSDYESSSNMPVNYELNSLSNNKTFEGTIISTNNGYIELDFFSGFQELILSIDNINTEGIDFFGKHSFFVNDSKEVVVALFPVGSLRIIVVDKKNNALQTPIRIDCSKTNGVQGYFMTDEFGVLSANYLPVGSCTIRSAVDDFIKTEYINISKGSRQELTIKFEEYSQKNKGLVFWFVTIIFIAVIINLKKTLKKKSTEKLSEKKELSSVKEDILTALGKKEQQVVRFMLKEQDISDKKRFYLSQASIVRGADIPKTSLVRIFDSLEQKNILKIEKFGKMKKISFTDWFESK